MYNNSTRNVILSILAILLLSIQCKALPRKSTDSIKEAKTLNTISVESEASEQTSRPRKGKSLQFFLDPSSNAFGAGDDQEPYLLDIDEQLEAALAAQITSGQQDNEILSRARPGRPKPHSGNSFANSPIYYIRLPPTPYVLVPGVGYVSQPPTLRPPPVRAPTDSPFVDLPVRFVSNAKPTGVYTWPPQSPPAAEQRPVVHYSRPKPQPTLQDSTIHTLDKGPYVFNGRPTDIFLLRNTYNSLYADALQNFYP